MRNNISNMKKLLILIGITAFLHGNIYSQEPGDVLRYYAISADSGNFTGQLVSGENFGGSVAIIDDLDGDGVREIVSSATATNTSTPQSGAIWILFMNQDGTVKSHQKIDETNGNFTGNLDGDDRFGVAVASLGDLDGDNVCDIAVGAWGDDDSGINSGAVYILFLNRNGTVKTHQKISATEGGLVGLTSNRLFGIGLASLGDLDGDGNTDISVGAPAWDNDGGLYRGIVFNLFLNSDGTVKSQQAISDVHGGLGITLSDRDYFGIGVFNVGDKDGDGIVDLIVSSKIDDSGQNNGEFSFVYLNADGTAKSYKTINAQQGGFVGALDDEDLFGHGVTLCGDLNEDGVDDLLVSSAKDDDLGHDAGALYVLFMDENENVIATKKLTADLFGGSAESRIGGHVRLLGDIDNDGNPEVIVPNGYANISSTKDGQFLIVSLKKGYEQQQSDYFLGLSKVSDTEGEFLGTLIDYDHFGGDIAWVKDINGDGIDDIVASAYGQGTETNSSGSVFVLFMNTNGTVKSYQKIDATNGGFTGELRPDDRFGSSIASLNDLDGDGIHEIAVGAWGDDDGNNNSGAVWILFLNSDGTVKANQKISATQGGLQGLSENRLFGIGITALGDLNGDSYTDIAVGAPAWDNDGGLYRGNVFVLFLNQDGTVKQQHMLSDVHGNVGISLVDLDRFGMNVQNIGDMNGDSIPDLAVHSRVDNASGVDIGEVHIVYLNADGTSKGYATIDGTSVGLTTQLESNDLFGYGMTTCGDLDGDGISDLIVGAPNDDDVAENAGAIYILLLNEDATVKSYEKISNSFFTDLTFDNSLGSNLEYFGDLNNDGYPEILVSAGNDDDGGVNRGAFYIVTVKGELLSRHENEPIVVEAEYFKSYSRVSDTHGNFEGVLVNGDNFGGEAAWVKDIDGDGIDDIIVGAYASATANPQTGAIWVLFMNEDGTVKAHQKIDGTEGGLSNHLDLNDRFGCDIASVNDLDGDGISDIAVGAWGDDDGNNNSGAVYILFLNSNGTVKASQKISATEGGLVGLTENRLFGIGITSLGDLDGDGYTDIAVGAPAWDNDGGLYRGAVFILFLNGDGTVKSQQLLNDVHGNLGISLTDLDRFGSKLQNLGDLNGDGITDLAIHSRINNAGIDTGELYFVYLNTDGTAQGFARVNASASGLEAQLHSDDLYGGGVTSCGDLDGDSIMDLIVSAAKDDDAGEDAGAIYILFLNEDASVKGYQKITNNFFTELNAGDHIGGSLEYFGDLNKDGLPEILITCSANNDGGTDRGAFYIVTVDGEVKERKEPVPSSQYILGYTRVSDTHGEFNGILTDGQNFGGTVEMINDLDGDGTNEIVTGAYASTEGLQESGAVWVLFMNQDGTVKSHQKIDGNNGGFTGTLDAEDRFGCSLASLGDLDGDGNYEIAVGAWGDDDAVNNSGAVWILFLNSNGTVKRHQKISAAQGGLVGLTENRLFGMGVESLGDMDGDNIPELAVGAPAWDNDGGLYRGIVFILFLNANGSVKSQQKLSDVHGGLNINLDDRDYFGTKIANLGDINNDGVTDIAVLSNRDDDEAVDAGAIYLIYLNANGTARGSTKISGTEGNFTGTLHSGDMFGNGLSYCGDIDNDGVNDLIAGAVKNDYAGEDAGAFYILFLNADGTVKNYSMVTSSSIPDINEGDGFGADFSFLGDINNDGYPEIAVSSGNKEDGGYRRGAFYIVSLFDDRFNMVGEIVGGDDEIVTGVVQLLNPSDSTIFMVVEIINGVFSFEDIPEGEYIIRVIPTGEFAERYEPTTIGQEILINGNIGDFELELNKRSDATKVFTTQVAILCYPNPTVSKVTIAANNIKSVELFSNNGSIVSCPIVLGEFAAEINLKQLPAGVYNAIIKTDANTITQSIIKK